jgi:hypothetical protein
MPAEAKPVLLRGRKPEKKAEPFQSFGDFTPQEPNSVTQVDGFECRVERCPIRIEKVEDIFDELPDFAQEIIANRYLNNSRK